MGMMYGNGSFKGGIDATVLAYVGNSTLTTSADNLGDAINEHEQDITDIKSNLTELDTNKQNKEWNIIYNTWLNRSASVQLPTTPFNEVLILVDYSGDSPTATYSYPIHVPYGYLGHGLIMGYTNSSYVQLKTSSTSITLYDIRINGTQKTGSVVYVYVR